MPARIVPTVSKPTIIKPTRGESTPHEPTTAPSPHTLPASFDFGGLAVHWKLDGPLSDGRFAVVHHPIAPGALAAPLHRHANEDEFSFVLRGRLGALIGDDIVTADPGEWVVKPRRQWHTFWNACEEHCEIIEVISPSGFEDYFREVAASWGDIERFDAINRKYSLEMRFDSVPGLCDRFGLTFPKLCTARSIVPWSERASERWPRRPPGSPSTYIPPHYPHTESPKNPTHSVSANVQLYGTLPIDGGTDD